jgi:hypothetical protein
MGYKKGDIVLINFPYSSIIYKKLASVNSDFLEIIRNKFCDGING